MPAPVDGQPTPTALAPGGATGGSASNAIAKRIASGAVIATLGFLITYWGALPFGILTFAVAAVMSWEWSRMVRGADADSALYVHLLTVLAAAVLTAFGMAGLAVAAVAAGAFTVLALVFGRDHAVLSMLGVVYTGLPIIALGWLRSDGGLGFLAAIFVLATVAVTDTAAYAAGRTIGGPKLLPSVSPNKTWSGLAGGIAVAAVFGAAFPSFSGSGEMLWLLGLAAVLAVIAQGGDLAESALKRHFELKDASDLIPGHGGFMDRMDGIVTASIAAALLAFAIDAYAPARALLYGS